MQPDFISNNKEVLIYRADCRDILSSLPDNKFQVIFADPPYFISRGGFTDRYGHKICNDKGEWDKSISKEEMDKFNYEWLNLCKSKLKDNGTIWVCGTYHNIFSVVDALKLLDFKIINVITWQKTNPQPSYKTGHFMYSTEQIVWAKKNTTKPHIFNEEELMRLNCGKEMSDVWKIPAVSLWEKKWGKHTTQKPLHLLYRILTASSSKDDYILDPFLGSGTTAIVSSLMGRKCIGIEKEECYYELSKKRILAIEDPQEAKYIQTRLSENILEDTVFINRVTSENFDLMTNLGICYLRAGDIKSSLLVIPGFERLNYIMLYAQNREPSLFKLKKKGFQIWTKEDLNKKGFYASHASYYAVLHFDKENSIPCKLTSYIKKKLTSGFQELPPVNLVIRNLND